MEAQQGERPAKFYLRFERAWGPYSQSHAISPPLTRQGGGAPGLMAQLGEVKGSDRYRSDSILPKSHNTNVKVCKILPHSFIPQLRRAFAEDSRRHGFIYGGQYTGSI